MTPTRNAMMQNADTAISEVAAARNEIGFANRAIFMEDLRIYCAIDCIGYFGTLPPLVTNYETLICKDSAYERARLYLVRRNAVSAGPALCLETPAARALEPRPTMTHYYFHFRNGDEFTPDPEGIDLKENRATMTISPRVGLHQLWSESTSHMVNNLA